MDTSTRAQDRSLPKGVQTPTLERINALERELATLNAKEEVIRPIVSFVNHRYGKLTGRIGWLKEKIDELRQGQFEMGGLHGDA